ncbi:parallel beta-helix domain-containing protein [Undibacterium sp. Ren11W]|uniref:parallel beta-helix domain-containing protein n=1 Tax=Undibacterium sp. Ren11W TaxID=3413045 RepID=UPI003BF3F1F1
MKNKAEIKRFQLSALSAAVLTLASCGGSDSPVASAPVVAAPVAIEVVVTAAQMNDNDMSNILFRLKEGSTLTLPAGKFHFDRPLIMNTSGVTIIGKGSGSNPAIDTILSFKDASTRNGLQASNVKTITLKNFAVEDAAGNAVFVSASTNVTMDGLRAEWTTDPTKTSKMAYGLYPVNSDNIIVKNSKVIGSEDAGIYVGQSQNIRVSNNEVYLNVAGVEIENSLNAIVENNDLHDNTGGVLVFSLPGTYRFKKGSGVLIQNNNIHDNNTPVAANASGFVTSVPVGTGIMVLAADNTEIKNNIITNHKTTSVLALSYQATGFTINDPAYNPFIHTLYAHGNTISVSGYAPDGAFKGELKPLVDGLFAQLTAAGLPALLPYGVWDGILDPEKSSGLIPLPGMGGLGIGGVANDDSRICIKNNTSLDTPFIDQVISYETLDINLIGLKLGASVQAGETPPEAIAGIPLELLQPTFPSSPRMNCQLTLPAIPAFPVIK